MKDVAIIGVGQSAFVRGYEGSIGELAFEAFKEAMEDAQITPKEIDASIICSAPEYDKQRTPSAVMAEYLGLNPQPTFYVESVCSSSSVGLRVAYSMIKAGLHDVVLVLGFQKMTEISSADSQERMGRGADIMWESPFGTMMPAYYAMYARAHFGKYGTTEEDLAHIRVKAATYGIPISIFRSIGSLPTSGQLSTPIPGPGSWPTPRRNPSLAPVVPGRALRGHLYVDDPSLAEKLWDNPSTLLLPPGSCKDRQTGGRSLGVKA